jgi:3-deoxy-alpha-D-manno-octulosonate 8-oxidase
MNISRNVGNYIFGTGSFSKLSEVLDARNREVAGATIFLVDQYFADKDLPNRLPHLEERTVLFINTDIEPTTDYVDNLVSQIRRAHPKLPATVVGIGGGITLDCAKALSNLLTNGGQAQDYQGWDLVKVPGVFKIGVPTVSGTGAEASRTCVMMNQAKNLKLGMNSAHTVFDYLILDPDLTASVPRDQYFYTGMDSYIHCVESLAGSYRHPIGDAFSTTSLNLCLEVFGSDDMQSDENRAKLMVASYLGGCAIANSFVGVVHPFSAGLSMVLGLHHCIANCIVMNTMEDFYPQQTIQFKSYLQRQRISLPSGICRNLSQEQYDRLYASTVVHEKPLINALGSQFLEILSKDRVIEQFKRM